MRTAMTYKDILVHLTEDPRNVARTDAALDLARRFGAHLTALYTLPPPQQLYYMGEYIPAELFQRQIDDAKKKAAVARTTFEAAAAKQGVRSEEHTSELQSLMRISYAVFCLKKKKNNKNINCNNKQRM